MRPQHIMFMGLLLAVGTIISLSYAGVGLGSEEVGYANAFTAFKQANILGVWSVTIPNVTFFFVGVRALTQMDFAFFTSGMVVVQWILYMVLGLGLTWGIFTIVLGVINGLFRRT